jgi:hypothetical protein
MSLIKSKRWTYGSLDDELETVATSSGFPSISSSFDSFFSGVSFFSSSGLSESFFVAGSSFEVP